MPDSLPFDGMRFRPLTVGDLPLLGRWLSHGGALEWYSFGVPPTAEEVARKYLPRILGDEPVHGHILELAGANAGYFQSYLLEDFPDHPAVPGADRAAGIDFFLAEEYAGRGLGPRAIRAYVQEAVFAQPEVFECWAGPDPRNLRSVRALQRAGFSPVTKTAAKDAILMRIPRDEALRDATRPEGAFPGRHDPGRDPYTLFTDPLGEP